MSAFGMNLRVTTDSKQGGRKYMEDCLSVKFQKSADGNNIEYTYLGIFDGHGGVHAAQYAKENLLDEITKQKGFWSKDDSQVLKAIKDGFLSTHHKMWKIVGSWPKTLSGHPSTAGTTVSVAFLKNGKLYVGHVGDSSVVLGKRNESMLSNLTGDMITIDHKPESPEELKRIEESGGAVVAKAGVQRVVWNRPRATNQGAVRRSTPIDRIPFLAIARALGDLWSYNTERDVFVVSPEPDVSVHTIDVKETRCIVLASDGLWNMVRAQEAVDLVDHLDEESRDPYSGVKPASCLVRLALDRWADRGLRADNTSVIVCILEPPEGSEPSPSKLPKEGAAPLARMSDGEDECLSDADCSEEDIALSSMDCEVEDDDADMSHLHMGSPAPFPKILYPSPHVLKEIKHRLDTNASDDPEPSPSTERMQYPRVITASAERFTSARHTRPMSSRSKLKTPLSAPPKVKRLNEKRNRRAFSDTPSSCPVRKLKAACRSHKLSVAQMRKRVKLQIAAQMAVDTSHTHNLRLRTVSPEKSIDNSRVLPQDNDNLANESSDSNELPHVLLCNDTKEDLCPEPVASCTIEQTVDPSAIKQQTVINSHSRDCIRTPSKEQQRCLGNRSPKQGLSAKSPLRIQTSLRADTPSMISPMWPNTLESANSSSANDTEEPLEGGLAMGVEEVLTENGTNKSAAIRNFTSLFNSQSGSQNKDPVPSSPTTRGCVRRLGEAALLSQHGDMQSKFSVKKVNKHLTGAAGSKLTAKKSPRINRRVNKC